MQLLHSSIADLFIVHLQHSSILKTTNEPRTHWMARALTAERQGAQSLRAGFDRVIMRLARYRLYRQTLAELRGLGNRDLADLGLNRSMLRRVAWQAAYDR